MKYLLCLVMCSLLVFSLVAADDERTEWGEPYDSLDDTPWPEMGSPYPPCDVERDVSAPCWYYGWYWPGYTCVYFTDEIVCFRTMSHAVDD